MPAILNQGLTKIRDALKSRVTHVGASTDATAFSAGQTSLSPGGGTNAIKASSPEDNVDFRTVDFSTTINGDVELTGLTIRTVGILDGSAATSAISRTVVTPGVGVQAGDALGVVVRARASDQTP